MWKMIEFNNWGTNCQMPCNYFTDPNTTILMATCNFLLPDQHNLLMTGKSMRATVLWELTEGKHWPRHVKILPLVPSLYNNRIGLWESYY